MKIFSIKMIMFKNFEYEASSHGVMLIATGDRGDNSFTRGDNIGGSPEDERKNLGKSDNLIVFESRLIK
jgi:hypothetical protein